MIRILHVDDNELDLEIFKIRLENLSDSIHVKSLLSAEEALSHLQSNEFDCVVSDLQMPMVSGLEFLAKFRERDKKTPFIILTGQGNEENAAAAFRAGASDYYIKEVSISHFERILNSIKKLVDAHRLGKERDRDRQKIIETETIYSGIINNINESVVILEQDLTVVNYNFSFELVCKRFAHVPLKAGVNLCDLFPGYAKLAKISKDKLITSEEQIQVEEKFEFPGRKTRYAQVTMIPVKEGSALKRIIMVINNTTELRVVEKVYDEAQKELERKVIQQTTELADTNEVLGLQVAERLRNEKVQRSLIDIAQIVTQNVNLNELYKQIHNILSKLIDTTCFYIALNEGEDRFSFPYCIDPFDEPVEGILDIPESLTAYVFRTGKPQLITSAKHDYLLEKGEVGLFGIDSKVWLGVPLQTKNSKLGVLVVQSYDDDKHYTEKDMALLSYVSNQVALALEINNYKEELENKNEELEQLVQQRTEQLQLVNEDLKQQISEKEKSQLVREVLLEISREAVHVADIISLMAVIHKQVGKIIPANNFYIILYDQETNLYTPIYFHDEFDTIEHRPLDLKATLTDLVRRKKTPVLFSKEDIHRINKSGEAKIHGTIPECWMAAPLETSKGVIGVMAVQDYHDGNAFTNEDLDILTYASETIAVSIERKLTEKEIKSLITDLTLQNEKLVELNKDLDSFTHSVSHDLRAPVHQIQSYIDLIKEQISEGTNEEVILFLDRIRGAGEKMSNLIKDLLALSRQSQQDISKGKVNLSQLCESLTRKLQEESPERQAEFSIEKNMFVNADEALLRIAMENLISNAWKFSSKETVSKIKIYKEEINDQTYYCIEDNGVGFDQKKADMLFVPFSRLHDEQAFKGTGIGLNTVNRIITKHGGEIRATGKPGKGAKFSFTFKEPATPSPKVS